MIVRLHLLLAPLLLLLLARTALAGQCMVSGDCVITGTVNGEWNDDWGCDNVNACWDEAACCDRLNGNWEYCQNGAGQHMCTTFTDTGKQCCKGDNGGGGTTSGGGGGDYDLADVLGKSILFYEAQRSGYYRGRVSWRGDSATGDRGPGGEDLEGGYYDAGDNLKLHFPFAAAFTFLSWSATSFPNAYNGAGEMDNFKDGIKWATDFMIKCHTAPDTLVAQVGDVDADHGFWGRPEDMNMARPAQSIGPGNPGSDLASDYASALASAYLLFKDSDSAYAATLLDHAKQLLQFAFDHPGKYTDSISTPVYGSSNYYDEMGLAKAWMAKATGDPADLEAAKSIYDQYASNLDYNSAWINWDDKTPAFVAMMCELTGESKHCNQLKSWCDGKIDGSPYSPKGEIFIDKWGSLRHAGNVAAICVRAASLGVNTDKYMAFARQQVNYILGSTGRSFVVGYGVNPPTHCHHRGASCYGPNSCCDPNCPDANPNVLTGALVGGPGEANDYYNDARNDYVMNEVALDYNSGFQMAVAGLLNDIMDSTTVPPTDPTAAPTDAPTAGTDPTNPTATTRDPNNNCPGGNLEACISLCPEEDADIYQACVHDCMENC